MNKQFYSLLLTGLITAFGACSLTIVGAGTALGTTLFGGIDHADYLAPVSAAPANALNQRLQAQVSQPQYNLAMQQATPEPQFEAPMAGHAEAYNSMPRLVGNAAYVQNAGPTIEWFVVPKWMAGAWHKQGDLTVSYRDLTTNQFSSMSAWTENEMTVTWGHQVDRQGNIWHADVLPLEKDGWSKGKLARFMMTSLKCEKTDQQQLVTRARYVVTESYNGSAQITDMFQQESLNDYTLMPDGELENMSSNRIYSSQGRPLREGGLVTRLQKIAAFTPIASQNNIDLAQSLNTYLNTHGMANLTIPNQ